MTGWAEEETRLMSVMEGGGAAGCSLRGVQAAAEVGLVKAGATGGG